MRPKFDVILLGEVWDLLDSIDEKSKDKILYNIDKAKYVNDPKLFKKLDELIWEFRAKHKKNILSIAIILGQNRQKRNFGRCYSWDYQKN